MRQNLLHRFSVAISLITFSMIPAFMNSGIAFASSPATSSSASVHQNTAEYHTVSSGDTLWSISETYHIPVHILEKWNSLTDQSILQLGQKLIVGWSNSSTNSYSIHQNNPIYIKIAAGDTLSSLANTYHVSLSQIEKWNGLSDQSVLQIGQKITIYPSSGLHPVNKKDPSSEGFGFELVAYSKQFIGTPYVWGGESPNGFDCSGFVQYILQHFGISVAHSSYSQFLLGTAVNSGNLQPGDLVFFDTDGAGASHSGIYVGDGNFINAAGNGIQIDSMSSGYWSDHYIGARRVQ